ncbi:MAG TPA: methyltransferase domain-containing protein [Bacteroidota bacterium]|nr:methyltransferase domain-containing protein [Bacteroidota bacterium]
MVVYWSGYLGTSRERINMADFFVKLHQLKEDPINYEHAVKNLVRESSSNRIARELLESLYCDENRDAAFERYANSFEFEVIGKLMNFLGVRPDRPLCEIGGGPGYLSWSLSKSGFKEVCLLEPSDQWLTGTAYLQSRHDSTGIHIENDLEKWYSDPTSYSTIITRNVLHHFRGLAYTIACIRQKIVPGGIWIAIREWYAETSAELYTKLYAHPFCLPHSVYEFAYPASHFVEAFEIAGFKLVAIVPMGYANNVLRKNAELTRNNNNHLTSIVNNLLVVAPWITARLYSLESFLNRHFKMKIRKFTRPQMMVFRRVELNHDDRAFGINE